MASASAVFFWSSSLLIRWHNRARCQAEIPLIALSEIVEPLLLDLIMLAIGIGFFAIAVAYVAGCERL
jgi:hypothetical protein